MVINGLMKMTLLDFPGRVACTVFTAGCNMRCPFCHNAALVTEIDPAERIEVDEILGFLRKRVGLLDGVAITGGEPLLQPDIADFIREVRALGFAVKLIAISLTLLACASWMGSSLLLYTQDIFTHFALLW